MGTTVDSGQTSTHSLTVTVVEQVANRENVDPLELPPLHDAIDPDALDALFDKPEAAVDGVTFRYQGYEVVVEGPERVRVTPLDDT